MAAKTEDELYCGIDDQQSAQETLITYDLNSFLDQPPAPYVDLKSGSFVNINDILCMNGYNASGEGQSTSIDLTEDQDDRHLIPEALPFGSSTTTIATKPFMSCQTFTGSGDLKAEPGPKAEPGLKEEILVDSDDDEPEILYEEKHDAKKMVSTNNGVTFSVNNVASFLSSLTNGGFKPVQIGTPQKPLNTFSQKDKIQTVQPVQKSRLTQIKPVTNDLKFQSYLAEHKRGGSHAKRRRKEACFDRTTTISAGDFEAQLKSTDDILSPLNLAPYSKRAMFMIEFGGVEKIFSFPNDKKMSPILKGVFERSLLVRPNDDDHIEEETRRFLEGHLDTIHSFLEEKPVNLKLESPVEFSLEPTYKADPSNLDKENITNGVTDLIVPGVVTHQVDEAELLVIDGSTSLVQNPQNVTDTATTTVELARSTIEPAISTVEQVSTVNPMILTVEPPTMTVEPVTAPDTHDFSHITKTEPEIPITKGSEIQSDLP